MFRARLFAQLSFGTRAVFVSIHRRAPVNLMV